jgi:hypothetical protein
VPDDETSPRTRRRDLIDQFCACHAGPCRSPGITQNGGSRAWREPEGDHET